jgi:hydrogenase nickel incorporation protein HypA/HybF
MHEHSVARALLELVDAEARARRADRVHRLSVRIGELSGVDAELLAAAYAVAREGTSCREAALEVRAVPARWACRGCGREPPRGGRLACPACDCPLRLVSGDEILLERIEMEVP